MVGVRCDSKSVPFKIKIKNPPIKNKICKKIYKIKSEGERHDWIRLQLSAPRKSVRAVRQADRATGLDRKQSGPDVVPVVLPRLQLSLRSGCDLRRSGS